MADIREMPIIDAVDFVIRMVPGKGLLPIVNLKIRDNIRPFIEIYRGELMPDNFQGREAALRACRTAWLDSEYSGDGV